MSVQGSPNSSREIRIPYPEEARKAARSVVDERRISSDEDRRARRDGTDAVLAASIANRTRKGRWSLSKVLLGYCPEFAASFAN